jgi:serine/threonine-protein kinase
LRSQWREEARILAGFAHEHLVEVYGFAESDTQTFIVEEWIDGATVSATVGAAGALNTGQALGVIRGALLGLAHLHERDMVHGDVSATNIMVDVSGTSKLIDFGLASVTGSLARPATRAFQAPEVTRGEAITPASDVYAAAAVLRMLLGVGIGSTDQAAQLDAGIASTLNRAMAQSPSSRYPDARAFLEALEHAAERRFGPAWWTQAGMGALATTAVAGLAAVGSAAFSSASSQTAQSGSGHPTPGSEPTVNTVEPAKLSPRVRATSRLGNSSISATTAVAAAAAGLAVIGIVTYAIVSNRGSHPTATDRAPTTAAIANAIATSIAPTTPAPASSSLPPVTRVQQYEFKSVITAISGGSSVDTVGKVFTAAWTFTAVCIAPGNCQTTIDTASGATFALPQAGPLERSGTSQNTCPTVARTQTFTFTQTLAVTPGPDGLPLQLAGTAHEISSGCSDQPTAYDYTETVTPIGPAETRRP